MHRFVLVLLFFIQSLIAETTIIGKSDRVDLPILKFENLKAKIDTGAKTSSLHCSYIEQINESTVVFEVLDKTHKKYRKKRYSLPIIRIATVRSSNGIVEKRYVISTNVFIFNKVFDTEFTLSNRIKMNYPILLGREFLQKSFLVDVRESNISFSQKLLKNNDNK